MTTGPKPTALAPPPAMDLRLFPPRSLRSFSQPNQTPPTFHDLPTRLISTLRSFLRPPPPPPPRPKPDPEEAGCALPLFRPYVAKLPWHGGLRGFLSQLFPRYGHYCGPNWSSGKDGGSMLWDRRPIDWLDFCCYCHDMGYDTHDQAKLLKADLRLLSCLERPRMATKGGAIDSLIYRSMYIAGLRYILVPYRTQLVKLQTGPPLGELLGSLVGMSFVDNRVSHVRLRFVPVGMPDKALVIGRSSDFRGIKHAKTWDRQVLNEEREEFLISRGISPDSRFVVDFLGAEAKAPMSHI